MAEGKGWARGKTAATDERVARAAASHVGLSYLRRTPLEQCKWPGAAARPAAYAWDPLTAYAVGLIATDGCLIEQGHSISFVSQDAQLVEVLLRCLGREPKYRIELTRLGREIYRCQMKDVVLYRWLEQVGLTPRKSLTLGSIHVPDVLLPHLVRGLLDGDGSVINRVWQADTTRRTGYYYEYLTVHFVSGSHDHVEWLRAQLRGALPLRGWIGAFHRPGRHPIYRLAFGKHDSIKLLRWLYVDRAWPCLLRKRAIWDDYVRRHSVPGERT